MIPSITEGFKMLQEISKLLNKTLDSGEAITLWHTLSFDEKESVKNAFNIINSKDTQPISTNKFVHLGCAIQVNVDDRGPIWVTGYVVKKLEHVQIPQYAVSCDDRLYYVDADKVYINAADIKNWIEKVIGNLF